MFFMCISWEQEHQSRYLRRRNQNNLLYVDFIHILKVRKVIKPAAFVLHALGTFFRPRQTQQHHHLTNLLKTTPKKEVGKAKFFDTTKASAASMASIERPCNTVPNSLRSPTKTSRHCLSDSSTRLRPRCPRSRASRRGPPYRVLSEK